MQKTNSILCAALILSLSVASVMHTATPESIAAAINFCQERLNTSDKDECQKLIEAKFTANFQEAFSILSRANFIMPVRAEDQKRLTEINEETSNLSKHVPALRNDQLTPEQTFEAYVRLLTRTLKRCNDQVEAKDFGHCLVNGWIDDIKMMMNTEDAVRSGQTAFSIQLLDIIAAYSQAGLQKEINRLETDSELAAMTSVQVDTLKALLEQVNASRAKLAPAIPTPAAPSDDISTEEEKEPSIIIETTIVISTTEVQQESSTGDKSQEENDSK